MLMVTASQAVAPPPRSRQLGGDSMRTLRAWFVIRVNWQRAASCALALLAFTMLDARAAEPRRVLLLHAFGHPYSPWSDMSGSFHAELIKKSPEPIDVYEVSLDTARV